MAKIDKSFMIYPYFCEIENLDVAFQWSLGNKIIYGSIRSDWNCYDSKKKLNAHVDKAMKRVR